MRVLSIMAFLLAAFNMLLALYQHNLDVMFGWMSAFCGWYIVMKKEHE